MVADREFWAAMAEFRPLPRDYVTLSVATTGFSPDKDVVVELSAVKVIDGKPAERLTRALCWDGILLNIPESLEVRIGKTIESFTKSGRHYKFSLDYLKANGLPPQVVFDEFINLWGGLPIVGHAAETFHLLRLTESMKKLNASTAAFDDADCIDVGLWFKAMVGDVRPEPDESFRSWQSRVGRHRTGGKWSMWDAVIPLVHTVSGVDVPSSPDDVDQAYWAFLAVEAYRKLMQASTGGVLNV